MAKKLEWTKEAYETSVSSRCWCFTPYDAGWTGWEGEAPSADDELRQIVAMEHELGASPEWVRPVVEGPMRWVGFCGHYLFRYPFLTPWTPSDPASHRP